MSESIIAGLQSEMATREKNVQECELALAKARQDLDAYRTQIGEALGLRVPRSPGDGMRKASARRKQIREMVKAGKTAEQIIEETGLPAELVKNDVERVRDKPLWQDEADEVEELPPPPAQRRAPCVTTPEPAPPRQGTKAERVLELVKAGRNAKQIAGELDTSTQAVYVHISSLRKEGLLPPVGETAEDDDDAQDGGDNIDLLRAEVQRQQAGQRGKGVNFATSEASGHTHRVITDRMGDGVTQPDTTSHQHRVYRFVMSRAAGHAHGVKLATGNSGSKA
jgi:hypothetical protein